MTKVSELTPGDSVTLRWHDGPRTAVFVAQTPHPIWSHLQLVIWRLHDGSWSLDALDPAQDVGQVTLSTWQDLAARLRRALLGYA
jgi:hypothetical protein